MLGTERRHLENAPLVGVDAVRGGVRDDSREGKKITRHMSRDRHRTEAAAAERPALPVDAECCEVARGLAVPDHPGVAAGRRGRINTQLAAEQRVDEGHRISSTPHVRHPQVELSSPRGDRNGVPADGPVGQQVVVDERVHVGVLSRSSGVALDERGERVTSRHHHHSRACRGAVHPTTGTASSAGASSASSTSRTTSAAGAARIAGLLVGDGIAVVVETVAADLAERVGRVLDRVAHEAGARLVADVLPPGRADPGSAHARRPELRIGGAVVATTATAGSARTTGTTVDGALADEPRAVGIAHEDALMPIVRHAVRTIGRISGAVVAATGAARSSRPA